MRTFRRTVLVGICIGLLAAAGCSAGVSVNSNGNAQVKGHVPPGQVVKETTPGHNK